MAPQNQVVTNSVNGVSGIYAFTKTQTGDKPDPGDVQVTRTINDNWTDPNRPDTPSYLASYHIVIPNHSVLLKGGLTFLVVSHDGFTLPKDIINGNEDWAAGAKAATGGNYGPYGQPGYSAVTDNKTLWDSLQNTGIGL
ncbi:MULTISPECIES: hypothetical protein [Lactobacillus]|uniref:hypothetical protein n=1 Tax=Lactobacillus TaxID=1578 RepID=UPI0024921246|nr:MULTISPECIES: hypothetical protein [Lactobacillus]